MNRLLGWAGSVVLVFFAVFCTLGALISAFGFSVDAPVLLLSLAGFALAVTGLAAWLRGKGILLALPVAALAIVMNLEAVAAGAKWVLFFITREFGKWFSIPVLFEEASAAQAQVTLFFAAAGILLMLPLSVAVCLRRSAGLTVLLTFPLVAVTFLLTEYTPEPGYIIGLLAVYLSMTLMSALHPDHYEKRGRAVFPALALAALLLLAAYLAAPPEQYRRSEMADSLNARIRAGLIPAAGALTSFTPGDWRYDTEYAQVADAGARAITGAKVLEVMSTRAGNHYLRSGALVSFDGRSWRGSAFEADGEGPSGGSREAALLEALTQYPVGDLGDSAGPSLEGMLVTKPGSLSDVSFLPYYTLHADSGPDGDLIEFYRFEGSLPEAAEAFGIYDTPPDAYGDSVLDVYTRLDASTAEALRGLAAREGIDASAPREEVAAQVARYVSSAAEYTLHPRGVPEGEDFAVYFLDTLKEGYCVHFATAAALMLRALDIPARFTCGFVVSIPEGRQAQSVTVTDASAHAWVEVYYNGVGWVPLEVTPPAAVPNGAGNLYAPPRAETPEPSASQPGTSPAAPTPGSAAPATPGRPSPPPSAIGRPGLSAVEPPREPAGALVPILLCAAALASALCLRRMLLRRLRARRLRQPDTNLAVLYAWRYASRLGRETPAQELEELALKARFSQHRISEEERAAAVGYAVRRAEETYRAASRPHRFWLRYVRGL